MFGVIDDKPEGFIAFITHKPAHDLCDSVQNLALRAEGSCLYMINPSGYALGFIIYHIKHERVYVSCKPNKH